MIGLTHGSPTSPRELDCSSGPGAHNFIRALFGILIAVISILVSLYADTHGESVEAYVLWALIVTITLAIVLSSITAGVALARMTGHDVPLSNIQGVVYVILFIITTCVLIVVVFGLRYF